VIDHRSPKAFGLAAAQPAAAAEPITKTIDAGFWPEKPSPQPPLSAPVLSRSLQHHSLPASIDDFALAQGLVAGGKLEEARELLLQRLADRPNHAPACALLGKVYANLSNWQEAERWCQLGLSVDALNLDAWYTLALVYQHQGQHARAVEMLKKVVYIDHRDILGHFSLANLLYKDRQLLPALKSLENARKLLEVMPVNDFIPRAEDISAGRLAQTVIELMQIWAKEALQTVTENEAAKSGGQFHQAGNGKRVGA
jgi:tetratricopeptide (TPR) repeat protein